MKTGRLVKTLAAAALVAAIACTAVSGQAAQVRGTIAASTVLQEVSKQEQINGINTGYVYSTAGRCRGESPHRGTERTCSSTV
ncbi:MAG: hypothetical protein ACLSAP_00790 [Oscillospiraceae bacterium]